MWMMFVGIAVSSLDLGFVGLCGNSWNEKVGLPTTRSTGKSVSVDWNLFRLATGGTVERAGQVVFSIRTIREIPKPGIFMLKLNPGAVNIGRERLVKKCLRLWCRYLKR
jgi:hypothetical protein